jgi:hypothetical protein
MSVLGSLLENAGVLKRSKDPVIFDSDKLTERSIQFYQKYSFSEGDLIELKPDLAGCYLFEYGQPLQVIENLTEPFYEDSKNVFSESFRKPIDIKVAVFGNQGQFLEHYVDSRHFMPYVKREVPVQTDEQPIQAQTDAGDDSTPKEAPITADQAPEGNAAVQ